MEKKLKKICPRCKGNGYFYVQANIGNSDRVPAQCTMCNSEGEVSYEDYSLYGAISIPSKLQ